MKTVHLKPQSLRPLSAAHRRWFWALMSLATVLIAVGWTFTIRGVLDAVPVITTQVQQTIEQAAEEVEDADIDPPVGIDQTKAALEALQAGYEAEKERQQELYGQENTTDGTTP